MSSEILHTVFGQAIHGDLPMSFLLTLVVECFTVGAAIGARARRRRDFLPWRYPRNGARSTLLPDPSPALWSVPLLTWALEATLGFNARLLALGEGLTDSGLESVHSFGVAAVIALGLLLAVQSTACLVLGDRAGVLGLSGRLNTAVRFAIMSVFLDMFFWFMTSRLATLL